MSKTRWKIDPAHSEAAFKVKHMMISTVTGHFSDFDALLITDGQDFSTAILEAEIAVDSIDTNNDDRDTHLKSDDFFNAAEYPEITFKGKSLNGSELKGELKIRDTVKVVTLAVEVNGPALDPYGQTKVGLEIRGAISRKDFGLKWNAVTEAGNVVVADSVKISIDAQFVREAS